MNSFEANKIFGAALGVVFVLFGGSLLAEGIFHAEAPEKPGFAIAVPDAPAGGGGAAPAANEVTPVGQLMQTANAEAGAAIFKRCQACHSGEKGGPNKVGPDLWDLVNRPIASHEGFSYSAAMTEFSQGKTVVWDWDHLNHFLHGPKQYIKGTAMGFAGIPKDQERADLLAYLGTLSDNPAALPAPDAGAPAGGEAAAPAAPAASEPNATTNANALPGDAVTQPQGAPTTDQTTGAAPTTPPSGAVPATGDNATSRPDGAPVPPTEPGQAAPSQPAAPAAPSEGAAPAPAPAEGTAPAPAPAQ